MKYIKFIIIFLIANIKAGFAANVNHLDSLLYLGKVHPARICEKYIGENSILTNQYIKPGQKVLADQIVCVFENSNLQNQVEKLEDAIFEQENYIKKLTDGSNNRRLRQIENQLARAENNLKLRLKNHADLTYLATNGMLAQEELENSKALMEEARLTVIDAQEVAQELSAKNQKNDLDMAKHKLNKLKDKHAKLNQQLAALTIKAPYDSILLPSEKNSNTIIFADVKTLKVVFYINDIEVKHIKPGNQVTIIPNAMLNTKSEANIAGVISQLELFKFDLNNINEDLEYKVTVDILEQDNLAMGSKVIVKVNVD